MAERMERWLRVPLVLLGAGLCACSGGFEPTAAEPCAFDQEVAVEVGSGPAPLITWTPACGMASLEILPVTGSPTSGWLLFTGPRAPENPLRSGIVYGQTPPEAIAPGPATALAAGTEYQVVISRWVGDSSGLGSLIPAGGATFSR